MKAYLERMTYSLKKVSNFHPPHPLPARGGNTPLHPSQEGIFHRPWWEKVKVRG